MNRHGSMVDAIDLQSKFVLTGCRRDHPVALHLQLVALIQHSKDSENIEGNHIGLMRQNWINAPNTQQ